jgi:hypothetical protein
MADKHVSHPQQVACPRCGMRRNLALHRIMATDAQECPRCWDRDAVEIPMAIYPPDVEPGPVLDQRTVNYLEGVRD